MLDDSLRAPSVTFRSETPSFAFRTAWRRDRISDRNDSEIARPAASSEALLMRMPDEIRSTD